eukprot:1191530-Prorocentrum_minimum.AAC.4
MLGVSTKVDCYGLSKYVVNNATYRRYLALYALMLPTSSETVITKCAPFGGVGANGPLEAMFIQIGPQHVNPTIQKQQGGDFQICECAMLHYPAGLVNSLSSVVRCQSSQVDIIMTLGCHLVKFRERGDVTMLLTVNRNKYTIGV